MTGNEMFKEGGSCHPETDNYWYALIGPARRKNIPDGGDFPMRQAVQRAFSETLGADAAVCSSGWGMTPQVYWDVRYAMNSDDSKRRIIKSYHDEGKPVPRGLKGWELLFKKEAKKAAKKAKKLRKKQNEHI